MILGSCRQGGVAPRAGDGRGGRGLLVDAMAVGRWDKRGEEEATVAVGGAMPKWKWCVLCLLSLVKSVKLLRSSYEVVTKLLRSSVPL